MTASKTTTYAALQPLISPCKSDEQNVLLRHLYPLGFLSSRFSLQKADLHEGAMRDRAVLLQNGITYKQIGDRFDTIFLKMRALKRKAIEQGSTISAVIIEGKFEIAILPRDDEEWGSALSINIDDQQLWSERQSPFITMTNIFNGRVLTGVTEHSGCLLRDHHLSKKGGMVDLDIKAAVAFLEIKSKVDYSCKFIKQSTWTLTSEQPYRRGSFEKAKRLSRIFSTQKVFLKGGCVAFIFGFKNLDDYDYMGSTTHQKIIKQGQSANKSFQEIGELVKKERAWRAVFTPAKEILSGVIKNPKPRYLHLFISVNPLSGHPIKIFEGIVSQKFESRTYAVFNLVVKQEPVLDPNDTVKVIGVNF